MSTDDNNGKRQISTNVLAWGITGLLGWVGFTLSALQNELGRLQQRMEDTLAQHAIESADLRDKTKEIVPRQENERRWEALEKHQSADEDRINQLERIVYSIASNGKIPASFEPR